MPCKIETKAMRSNNEIGPQKLANWLAIIYDSIYVKSENASKHLQKNIK